MRACRIRHRGAVVAIALGTVSAQAPALEEVRQVDWAWTIYSSDFGHYDTPEQALAAWNAQQEQRYAAAASRNCGSAHKIIYRLDPKLSILATIVNGQRTYFGTDGGTGTSYTAACTVGTVTVPAKGPHTHANAGGIGVGATISCPAGFSLRSRLLPEVVIDGRTIAPREQVCVRNVPATPVASCSSSGEPDSAAVQGREPSALFGNPIDALGGFKVARETDYAVDHLKLRRSYSSATGQWAWEHAAYLVDLTGRTTVAPPQSILFANVRLFPPRYYENLNDRLYTDTTRRFPLIPNPALPDQRQVVVVAPNGQRLSFVESPTGTFTALNARIKPELSLVSATGGPRWRLRMPEGQYLEYSSSGQLLTTAWPDGQSLRYAVSGQTLTASDPASGRSLTFTRANASLAPGLYDTVTLPDGSIIRYEFDTHDLVRTVRYADDSLKRYLYLERGPTNTSANSTPNWLRGIIDERGIQVSTYAYDNSGPISTELAGGVNKYTFNTGSTWTVITPPNLGPTSRVTWERGPDGELRMKSRSQPAGSGCPAASSSLTYDANGNIASRTDFNNARTCYVHDPARNLEQFRIEGVPSSSSCSSLTAAAAALPAGSRRISTEWHEHWRWPTRIAEPGRITTRVYNGQPDPLAGGTRASCAPASALLPDGKPIAVLCRSVQQATTDPNGALGFAAALQAGVPIREERWTYDAAGRVLSHDGPRTDVSDLTTYSYYADTAFTGAGVAAVGHTVGDLRRVTNATGKPTEFTKYDKHGQLLESIDANGVVSSFAYDRRQRLLSTTVGGQKTSYTYDLAGQLKRVTLPDTTWVGFDYDAAQRRTAAYDSLGNRIDYELDNAGNVTGEKAKDAGGILRRQLNRSIDALGRVQQTTGRAP